MTQVQFYQLLSTPFERAVPKLLEKAYSAKLRTQLVLESEERVEFLNQALWTYDQDSFLPHGSMRDTSPEKQPILLTTAMDAPNAPELIFITDGRTPEDASRYKRVIDMFDGRDAEALAAARSRWSSYKGAGHEVSYFQQTDAGNWEKKA